MFQSTYTNQELKCEADLISLCQSVSLDGGIKGVRRSLPLLFTKGMPTALLDFNEEELDIFLPYMIGIGARMESSHVWSIPSWWDNTINYSATYIVVPSYMERVKVLRSLVWRCYLYHSSQKLIEISAWLAKLPRSCLKFVKSTENEVTILFRSDNSPIYTIYADNLTYDLAANRNISSFPSLKNLASFSPVEIKKESIVIIELSDDETEQDDSPNIVPEINDDCIIIEDSELGSKLEEPPSIENSLPVVCNVVEDREKPSSQICAPIKDIDKGPLTETSLLVASGVVKDRNRTSSQQKSCTPITNSDKAPSIQTSVPVASIVIEDREKSPFQEEICAPVKNGPLTETSLLVASGVVKDRNRTSSQQKSCTPITNSDKVRLTRTSFLVTSRVIKDRKKTSSQDKFCTPIKNVYKVPSKETSVQVTCKVVEDLEKVSSRKKICTPIKNVDKEAFMASLELSSVKEEQLTTTKFHESLITKSHLKVLPFHRLAFYHKSSNKRNIASIRSYESYCKAAGNLETKQSRNKRGPYNKRKQLIVKPVLNSLRSAQSKQSHIHFSQMGIKDCRVQLKALPIKLVQKLLSSSYSLKINKEKRKINSNKKFEGVNTL